MSKRTDKTNMMLTALRALYNNACHHPRCVRGHVPHTCSCGLSAALEQARAILYEAHMTDLTPDDKERER